MKNLTAFAALFCMISLLPASALAHFGMLLPSGQVIMDSAKSKINLDLRFWHPFINNGMDMEKPVKFGVLHEGRQTDLLDTLKAHRIQNFRAWSADFSISQPGLYTFYMEPAPYWEEAEDCFIIHYTKAYVTAFGDDSGWDEPTGLKTEIVPLSKPYALYAGNLFQGLVLLDGKPVPGAEVEIEWFPGDSLKGETANEMLNTQTVKADLNGIFSYAMPLEGWWGFAALNTAKETLKHNGLDKPVELGAVLWLRAFPAPRALPLK